MKTVITIELGNDVAKAVQKATKEFRYSSEEAFVIDAVRRRLKESKVERRKAAAWHSLLSTHLTTKEIQIKPKETYTYRPRFGLKDLLKQELISEV